MRGSVILSLFLYLRVQMGRHKRDLSQSVMLSAWNLQSEFLPNLGWTTSPVWKTFTNLSLFHSSNASHERQVCGVDQFAEGTGCFVPHLNVMRDVSPWHIMACRRVSKQWTILNQHLLWKIQQYSGRTVVSTKKKKFFRSGVWPVMLNIEEFVNTFLHYRQSGGFQEAVWNVQCNGDDGIRSSGRNILSHLWNGQSCPCDRDAWYLFRELWCLRLHEQLVGKSLASATKILTSHQFVPCFFQLVTRYSSIDPRSRLVEMRIYLEHFLYIRNPKGIEICVVPKRNDINCGVCNN